MKKIAMVLVCVLMFSFMGVVSYASSRELDKPSLYWEYTNIVSASLGIEGTKAYVYGEVFTGHSECTIKMAVTLQKKVNGTWKKVASWSGSDKGVCGLEESIRIQLGYDYRTVVNATVYDENGDYVESVSDTSYTVSA